MFPKGWPQSSDDWDNQMLFFMNNGYRLVGIDGETTVVQRRCRIGHDMDHYIAGVIGSKTPR